MGCGASNQPNETMQIALESCRKAVLAHIDNGYFSDELGGVLDIDSNSSDDAKCSALRATVELETEELAKVAPQLAAVVLQMDTKYADGVRQCAMQAIKLFAGRGSCSIPVHLEDIRGYVPQLAGMLQDSDPGVRRCALEAIYELAPEELVKLAPQLAGMLQDSAPGVRRSAVEAIGELASEELAKLEPQLVDMLQDNDPDVRQRALGTTIIIKEYRDLMTMS